MAELVENRKMRIEFILNEFKALQRKMEVKFIIKASQCPYCATSFSYTGNLNKHVRFINFTPLTKI